MIPAGALRQSGLAIDATRAEQAALPSSSASSRRHSTTAVTTRAWSAAAHAGLRAGAADAFELSQPAISHHMKVLHEAGLVDREKRGVWVYYRARPQALAAIGALTGCAPV
jgi:DNA-binding transcriptional ArsR family regulator